MQENQKPSIGRIVHYIGDYDNTHIGAMITAVNDDGTVNLTLFGPNGGMGFRFNVRETAMFVTSEDEGKSQKGTWHWPERN